MAELNKVTCGGLLKGNTGVPQCYMDLAPINGIILTPIGYTLTKTEIANTLLSKLQTSTLAARANRIYPVLNFVDIKDNTEQPSYQTLGFGRKVLLKEGKYSFEASYLDGGLCLSNQLRNFNYTKWSAFLVDANGVLVGTKVGDNIMAIPLNLFYASPYGIATSSQAASYKLNMEIEPKYLNEEIGFVQTKGEFDIFDSVKGLLNLVIKTAVPLLGGQIEIMVTNSCGGDNIYDVYGTNLANITAWISKNATTKNGITITAAVPVPANKTIALTLDTADTDYPAVASKLTIELNTAAILAAAPILMVGYEGANIITETV